LDLKNLPSDLLIRFLHQQMTCKIIGVAVVGDHAFGYAREGTPLMLQGLHVEPTENLVGLNAAPRSFNWVGEFEGQLIDFTSAEIGPALPLLLKGDGSILERILAPIQIVPGRDLRRLQDLARVAICRRSFNYYRNFSKGVLSDFEGHPPRTIRRCLSAYRTGLTGVHLLRTGEVELFLPRLAQTYGFSALTDQIQAHQQRENALLDQGSPWVNRMAKLHALLENAYESSELPVDPKNPADVEEYLLDMRRRFFDAHTVQQ